MRNSTAVMETVVADDDRLRLVRTLHLDRDVFRDESLIVPYRLQGAFVARQRYIRALA